MSVGFSWTPATYVKGPRAPWPNHARAFLKTAWKTRRASVTTLDSERSTEIVPDARSLKGRRRAASQWQSRPDDSIQRPGEKPGPWWGPGFPEKEEAPLFNALPPVTVGRTGVLPGVLAATTRALELTVIRAQGGVAVVGQLISTAEVSCTSQIFAAKAIAS